ncbi:MAG TPA: cytochrome c3 family protein [Opitutaceae bacterium]|nr:cytochrome c3 family protein [Opitutaceae bacterium]
MNSPNRTPLVLSVLAVAFAGLAAAFLSDSWGYPAPRPDIPLVDKSFLDTATWRRSYADLVKAKEDLSDFDCYGCHEKGQPPPLRYDENHKLIVPQEHSDVVMGHGTHGRNNNCFNCHNENDLTTLQPRDGRTLKFTESTELCGSCHGPTIRDWDSGAHGRTNGYWNTKLGPAVKRDCVNCHNPHSPKFPGRQPAPAPHTLRQQHETEPATEPNPSH